MAIRGDATTISEKWATRLGSATADITAGVNRVTVAPGQQAAAKFQKWQQAIAESGEKWRRNVARVSLESWKDSMITIGIPRVAQGAQAKKGKMQAFLQEFLPHLERGQQAVASMADTTFEDRVAKAVAMMRHNRDFKRGG